MSEELIYQVKKLIIDSLRIEGMSPEEIDTEAPLFGEGLGLDSSTHCSWWSAMEKDFGVVVPDAATGTKVFQSVRTMAEYIAEHRQMKLLLVSPGWPKGRLVGGTRLQVSLPFPGSHCCGHPPMGGRLL